MGGASVYSDALKASVAGRPGGPSRPMAPCPPDVAEAMAAGARGGSPDATSRSPSRASPARPAAPRPSPSVWSTWRSRMPLAPSCSGTSGAATGPRNKRESAHAALRLLLDRLDAGDAAVRGGCRRRTGAGPGGPSDPPGGAHPRHRRGRRRCVRGDAGWRWRAGAVVSGCDPGGASPYTAAIEAAGIPFAAGHSADARGRWRTAAGRPASRPPRRSRRCARSPGAGRRARGRHRHRAVAAGHRGRRRHPGWSPGGVAGTHGKSTVVGLAGPPPGRRRRRPGGVRGCPHARGDHRRRCRPRRAGGGATPSWWRRTSTPATSTPYRPDVAVLLNAEWDHPDVFADEAAVLDAFEGWLRAPGPRAGPWSRTSATPGSRDWWTDWATGRGAWSGRARRSGRSTGTGRPVDPASGDLEVPGAPRRLGRRPGLRRGRRDEPGRDARAARAGRSPQCRQRGVRRCAGEPCWASLPRRHRRGPGRLRWGRSADGGQGRAARRARAR